MAESRKATSVQLTVFVQFLITLHAAPATRASYLKELLPPPPPPYLEPSPSFPTSYYNVTDPELLQKLHVPVQEVWHASAHFPNFKEVATDQDQREVTRWNDLDMSVWLRRGPLSMDALLSLRAWPEAEMVDVQRLIAIYKQKIYWLLQEGPYFESNGMRVSERCIEPCNQEFEHWQWHMERFLAGPHSVVFPDVVFYLNVNDWPCSSYHTRLPAPLLSYQKDPGSEDILVPTLHDVRHPLYIFPWEHKVDKAFMRATAYCQGGHAQTFVRCARSYFAMKSRYEDVSHLLEAGLTSGFGQFEYDKDPVVLRHGPLPGLNEFPLRDHARYRYLLDTDGMTASYRASKLMFFNSLIFKQESPWFEWYTRSLVDGVHHIKFWLKGPDDIFDLIRAARADPARSQAIALNAMKFAYRYCTETPRKLYWRRALEQYKKLFPAMDEWLGSFNWTVGAP